MSALPQARPLARVGEAGLRLCYARSAADLEEAVRRIAAALPRL